MVENLKCRKLKSIKQSDGQVWLDFYYTLCFDDWEQWVEPAASRVQRTRNFSASFILFMIINSTTANLTIHRRAGRNKKVWISSFSINYQPSSTFLQSSKNAHSFPNFMLCLKIEYRKYMKSWLVFLENLKESLQNFKYALGLGIFSNIRICVLLI